MKNIICVVGGLGNQMFQQAFAIALSEKYANIYLNDFLANHKQSHYGNELTKLFGTPVLNNLYVDFFCWLVRKCTVFKDKLPLFVKGILRTMHFFGIQSYTDYSPDFSQKFPLKTQKKYGWTIWYGGFQTENYFVHIQEQIRKTFTFPSTLIKPQNVEIGEKMKNSNSCFIHLRRGDYLLPQYKDVYEGICTQEYYRKAIQYMSEKINIDNYYIFSDDIPWVKENIEIPQAIFVDWNTQEDSWQDMYLMTQCNHGIVANSTFSWWGAWLIENENKIIISPEKYTNSTDKNDFYPENWIKIKA